MRIGVLDSLVAQDATRRLEIADDVLVGVEDQLAFVVWYQRGEFAVHVHGDNQFDVLGGAGV